MDEQPNVVSAPGGRVAGRLARILSDAMIYTRRRMARTQSDVGTAIFTEVTNHVSDEVRVAVGPLFRALATHPDTAEEVRPLLHYLGNTRGQAFGWMGGAATSGAMAGGLTDLLTNALAPAVSMIIATHPNTYLSPEQSALLGARGIAPGWGLQYEAARKGVSADRFQLLQRLVQRDLTQAEVFELHNRGLLDRDEAFTELVKGGMSRESATKSLTLAKVPLSPEQAAQAWARNLVSDGEVGLSARAAGLTSRDADTLMGLAGEPPDTTSTILAWRRGIIDESDVDRAIVQGPIRNEWIPVIKALQEEPLPPTEAASAVTQGHLTHDRALAKARLSGITPEDFTIMVENSGIPPGLDFATEALNRGIITEDQFTAMFLESRIKNRYIELMLAMRRRIIPAETVRLAYRYKEYPLEQAIETLMGHGYSEPDARALLALEDARAREGTKDLSRAQILDLYGEDVIDRDQTAGMLGALGFDAVEVEWMLTLEEGQQVKRFINMIETRVRNAYVSGNIDDTEAATLLDRAGVGERRRDNLLSLWDVEKESVSRQLTVAQIQQALRRGIITAGEAKDRFAAMGFTETDASIIVELTTGG